MRIILAGRFTASSACCAASLQPQALCCRLLLQQLLLLPEQGQLLLQQVPGSLWQGKREVPRLTWIQVRPAITETALFAANCMH
jgi:hypothetical protein